MKGKRSWVHWIKPILKLRLLLDPLISEARNWFVPIWLRFFYLSPKSSNGYSHLNTRTHPCLETLWNLIGIFLQEFLATHFARLPWKAFALDLTLNLCLASAHKFAFPFASYCFHDYQSPPLMARVIIIYLLEGVPHCLFSVISPPWTILNMASLPCQCLPESSKPLSWNWFSKVLCGGLSSLWCFLFRNSTAYAEVSLLKPCLSHTLCPPGVSLASSFSISWNTSQTMKKRAEKENYKDAEWMESVVKMLNCFRWTVTGLNQDILKSK